jgi:hypothetical protein
MVVTISGEAKPIKWIGRRSYAAQLITGNRAVLPIVVRAGALAPDIPVRDLWVSPRHALLLDGVFVPAELLVNAQTILQAEAVDQIDYFHLEFEAHEVILAEGTPAEATSNMTTATAFTTLMTLPRFTPTTRGPRSAIAYRWRSRECPS